MKNRKTLSAIIVSALFVATCALAAGKRDAAPAQPDDENRSTDAVAAAPAQSDAEQLSTLQSQLAVLKAQQEVERVKADIRKLTGDAPPFPSDVANQAKGGAPVPQQGAAQPRGSAAPAIYIVSVSGFGSAREAAISINGRMTTLGLGAGTTLLGATWVVTKISETGVTLVSGKSEMHLSFE